jgi:hypothetical protein
MQEIYLGSSMSLSIYDSNIIDAPEFPDRLTRLTVDTFLPFRNRTNFAPRNGGRVDLHFSSSKILDWQSNISGPTPNASEIVIQGVDDGWRASVHAYFQRLFASRKNYRGFLHAAFTYDAYLWLIFIPFYFYAIVALDSQIDNLFVRIPTVLKAAMYIYSFFVFANLYRVLIGYIRWTFQSIELTGVPSTQQKHRRFWGFLITVIIAPILIAMFVGR